MDRLRVLVIAEEANPAWVSVPLVGWSHARALAEIVDIHLVTQVRNRADIEAAGLREGLDFTAIDSEAVARPLWRAGQLLRGGAGRGWTTLTALNNLAYRWFEHLVWRRFREDLTAGRFDVVHRLTPLSPTVPSSLAGRCRAAGVPFVLGPLNGGVPWPRGFDAARRREREWLSYARGLHRVLPGYRATRRHASAIIVASRDTLAQVPPTCRNRCVYIPENGARPGDVAASPPPPSPDGRLRLAFVGRLVPYKGPDMLLEAATPLLRAGRATLEIVGDGPMMEQIAGTVRGEGLEPAVTLHGWLAREQAQRRLAASQVLAFPSIREFGGGVVLEAMAAGVVPLVVEYGGPAELVTPSTGFTVPIGPRREIVAGFRAILESLADDPAPLAAMGRRAIDRVAALFTWPAKARQTLEVYRWVAGDRTDRPDFGMPLSDATVHEHATRNPMATHPPGGARHPMATHPPGGARHPMATHPLGGARDPMATHLDSSPYEPEVGPAESRTAGLDGQENRGAAA